MDFSLSYEQQSVQALARDFATGEIAPRAQKIDETGSFDWDLHRRLADLGLVGMTVPEAYGGAGADTLSWCLVIEEISKASSGVANALTLTTSMTNYILALGTEAQKQTFLPALVRGEKLCAFGLTEPGAGSDAKAVSTTARLNGSHYVLNGQKMFISGARVADLFVVVATLDKSLGARGIRTFLVEKGTEGLSCGEKLDLLGMRGMETAPLFLDDCRVPQENILGADIEGFKAVMQGLDGPGRLGAASMAVGLAQAAFEASLAYARDRVQFGQPIANFQAIQFMLADMSADISAARMLVYLAAWRRDQGLPHTKEASHAKIVASDVCVKHVANAMQIFGGYSYSREFPVERYYRDAKIHQIWDGTNEIQRIIVARQLMKET